MHKYVEWVLFPNLLVLFNQDFRFHRAIILKKKKKGGGGGGAGNFYSAKDI